MIDKKQPYFIALYNLHLTAKEIPLPEEKEKLVDTVYRYFDSPPLNTIIPQRITHTGEKSYRQLFDDGSSLEITKADLVYSHPQEKDWWTEKYQFFLEEYAKLRNLIDGYIDGIIKLCYLLWLDDRLEKINTGLVWKQGTSFQIIQMNKYKDEEIFLLPSWIKPQQRVYLQQCNPVTTLFFQAYLELIGVFEEELGIQRCQLDKCNNILLKSGNQKYCDTCKDFAKKEVDKQGKRKAAEQNHIHLSALIDEWLPSKGEKSIDAYSLMWQLRKISKLKKEPRFLQIPRSLGKYLNLKEVQDMLKKREIHVEIYKNRKGATYNFKRIQS